MIDVGNIDDSKTIRLLIDIYPIILIYSYYGNMKASAWKL